MARRLTGPLILLLPPTVLLVVGLLTPTDALFPHQGDVDLYRRDAAALVGGELPYRDFRLEYPPLALAPMVIPYVLSPGGPPSLDVYKWLFLAWQAGLLVVLGLVLRRLASLGAFDDGPFVVGGRLTVLTVAAVFPIAWRFDLFPATLATIAVLAAVQGRAVSAGVVVALGVLAKLFPIVLLPVVAARWLAARDTTAVRRLLESAALMTVVGLAPFVAVGGLAAFTFLEFQVGRGLQAESIGGGLVLLAGALREEPVTLSYQYLAVHVTGGFADAWLVAVPFLALLGFGFVGLVTYRWIQATASRDARFPPAVTVALAAAWVLGLLIGSKILSVQYVVWLLPFAALLARAQFWLAAAICCLSMAIHPWLYDRLIAQELGPILLLNLRNALVLGLFAMLLMALWRGARTRPANVVG